jgi:hypothetical protein
MDIAAESKTYGRAATAIDYLALTAGPIGRVRTGADA